MVLKTWLISFLSQQGRVNDAIIETLDVVATLLLNCDDEEELAETRLSNSEV